MKGEGNQKGVTGRGGAEAKPGLQGRMVGRISSIDSGQAFGALGGR